MNGNEILYSQETHITFWCAMRFHNFPLDSQTCKFKVKVSRLFVDIFIICAVFAQPDCCGNFVFAKL